MDELESRISSVLGDPEQMEKITKLAQSFMAGTGNKTAQSNIDANTMPDADMIKRIAHLMSLSGEKGNGETAMLEAISPYLSDKRRGKMEKALKIAKLVRLAKLAVEESESGA